jgi:thioredoxin-related protein
MSVQNSNPDGLPEILPVPASLRAAAQAARARREPVVVMVTLKGCAFCDVVRNNYLGPMFHRGEVYAVQVNMLDRRTQLQSFAGTTTTPHAQAREWRARIAPTILFMDYDGREVAERLEGMTVADFYGQYLTQRIEEARRLVRRA